MTDNENEDQIRDIIDGLPERLKLTVEGVDHSVQQEYLQYAEELDFNQYSEEDISTKSHSLFIPSTSPEDKKETLAVLAHRGTLEAYRTIERFLETAEHALKDWGMLALQECRMFLEGSLSDRNVGILMTGLGGENNRLRYFFVIRSRDDDALTTAQERTIKQGFSYICSKFDSILEEIQSHHYYATMKVLIPMDVAVAEIAEGGIEECNTYGDFLSEDYYVTNVKIPTEAEIQHYLSEMGRGRE
ncbi:hypothetical protein ACFLV5_00540 [Chloroflexota bacterium]